MYSNIKKIVWGILLSWMVFLPIGCENNCGPTQRIGAFFGSPYGIDFHEPENLGKHHYGGGCGEYNGMVYTCKGGFIDIAHLREAADRTYYMAQLSFHKLIMEDSEFSFQIVEPAHYFVKIQYPSNWRELPIDEKISRAEQAAILLGQYIAQKSTLWHEIVTWYGFASSGVFSEHISSFSWEDPYSDLIGTILAVKALENKQCSYEESMTKLLNQELQFLDVQPAQMGKKALTAIEDNWYTTRVRFMIVMKKRNFDIGTHNGMITPWLVPGICSNSKPLPQTVPGLESLAEMGFKIELEIEPKEFEKWKIVQYLELNGSKRINPEKHFPLIMEHIRKQAQDRYGADVETPKL